MRLEYQRRYQQIAGMATDECEPPRSRKFGGYWVYCITANGGERGRRLLWCPGAELNHRHLHFQCSALPTELPGQLRWRMGVARGRVIETRFPAVQTSHFIKDGVATNFPRPLRAFHPRPRPRSPGWRRRRRASGADRCRHSACCRMARISPPRPCGRSDTAGRSCDCSRSWRAYGKIASGHQTALSQPKRMG
jgi:hypothetical protein